MNRWKHVLWVYLLTNSPHTHCRTFNVDQTFAQPLQDSPTHGRLLFWQHCDTNALHLLLPQQEDGNLKYIEKNKQCQKINLCYLESLYFNFLLFQYLSHISVFSCRGSCYSFGLTKQWWAFSDQEGQWLFCQQKKKTSWKCCCFFNLLIHMVFSCVWNTRALVYGAKCNEKLAEIKMYYCSVTNNSINILVWDVNSQIKNSSIIRSFWVTVSLNVDWKSFMMRYWIVHKVWNALLTPETEKTIPPIGPFSSCSGAFDRDTLSSADSDG